MSDPMEGYERVRRARSAFSPTAPINRRDLFAGRTAQMISLVDAVDEPGQHVVLFGERGVGKTSLVAVASELLSTGALTVRVNCSASDTFPAVWKRAFSEISLSLPKPGVGFGGSDSSEQVSLASALGLPDELTPDHVRAALRQLATGQPIVVFFDEFDRIANRDTHREFSDCIKTLSDHAIPVTIVLVGVADDVEDLIIEHASVERALAQINMPRMNNEELSEIVLKGLKSIDSTIDAVALQRVTRLSQGLPHYTHLLAQHAAVNAVLRDAPQVSPKDVEVAVKNSLKKTQESIASTYYKATYSARENLYKQVLLACAVATADDRGYFSAAAVRDSLSSMLGRRMEIPSFSMHLSAFTSNERGHVLRREGVQRKFRYRFANPLLQPYVLMRGISDGLLPASSLD